MTRQQASDALPGWRYPLGRLHVTVQTRSVADALRLAEQVVQVCESAATPTVLDLRGPRLHLVLASGLDGGVTAAEITAGLRISEIIEAAGLTPDHARLTEVEVAIDCLDIAACKPFWAAVLGWPERDDDLIDPDNIGPSVWFQQMDAPRPQRNRIHLDVTVAHDEAEARIARAIAAGGHLVSDSHAPSFWVLADPEGNEACVCTWQARD